MRTILAVADQELVWRQPSVLRYDYELRIGEEVLATLHWRSLAGTYATAVTADGTWTFKRVGFLNSRVTARPEGIARDAATFEPRWTGAGTLTLTQGIGYRWGPTNGWQTRWGWHNADGTPIVQFHNKYGMANQGQVELAPAALALPPVTHLDAVYHPIEANEAETTPVTLPEIPLLVTLGWYLLVLAALDAASGTT